MSNPKAFTSYIENENKLNMLTDEQAGRLYKSLFAYARTGEAPNFSEDPLLAYAFADFVIDIDRDCKKYEETCRRRSEAGKKGGRPKAQIDESYDDNDETEEDLEKQNKAKKAIAFSGKQNKTKLFQESKKSKAKTKAKAKAKVNTDVFTYEGEPDYPDFEKRAEFVLKEFQRFCPDLIQPDKLTDHRRRLIYQAEIDGVNFERVFTRAQKSDFLTGRDGKGGGFGIDWVLEPNNRQKIIEGNYDNRGHPKASVYSVDNASFDVSKFEKSSMFDD